jgi:hypothetical protein
VKRHAVTLVVLALVVAGIAFRQKLLRTAEQNDPQPQDAIYAMLDAARAGDVKGYLASYIGPMESSLRQSVIESGEAAFAKYLRDTNAPVKGIAVQAPQTSASGDVTVRVEYVYQDRNEAQTMLLRKTAKGWKIARVDGAERVKTLVPYGTPVE